MATKAHTETAATGFDKTALRRKYAEERAKRIRPDGNDQYQRLEGKFAAYAEDPHMPVRPREPVRDLSLIHISEPTRPY